MSDVQADAGLATSEAVKVRARRICELADQDTLMHPDDGFTPSPLIALSIYHHVRLFAAGFGELNTCPNREVAVANVLSQIHPIYVRGANHVSRDQGLEIERVIQQIPAADLLDVGLRKKYELEEKPGESFVYFFILALDQLVEFVDLFNSAYRTTKQLRRRAESELSHRGVIAALAALLCAQAAVEKGMQQMTTTLGAQKVHQLIAEITARDRRKSEIGKNAALALHGQPGGNHEKREKIRSIWASGKYSSRTRCAEEECAALNMSYDAARKALRNTPVPSTAS